MYMKNKWSTTYSSVPIRDQVDSKKPAVMGQTFWPYMEQSTGGEHRDIVYT